MLRLIVKAASYARCQPLYIINNKFLDTTIRNFKPAIQHYHHISPGQNETSNSNIFYASPKPGLLQNSTILQISQNISRPVTKFSLQKGKRKTVKAALKRFYRLNWGGWIRTKAGRHKKMWKKSESQKRRLREHVLCNGTQSWLLDKMVTKYWRKPKYYVDDPYEPYHQREEYFITRRKPA